MIEWPSNIGQHILLINIAQWNPRYTDIIRHGPRPYYVHKFELWQVGIDRVAPWMWDLASHKLTQHKIKSYIPFLLNPQPNDTLGFMWIIDWSRENNYV